MTFDLPEELLDVLVTLLTYTEARSTTVQMEHNLKVRG